MAMPTATERKVLLKSFWQEASEKNLDYRKRATTSFHFLRGGEYQWDSADLSVLREEGRPAITFNVCKRIRRNLSGYQRQNKNDIKVLARRGGTAVVAQVIGEVIKYIEDTSNAAYTESRAFDDGISGAKGWIVLDIDYDDDPINGDIKIKTGDPFAFWEDPNSKAYDLNEDAQYIFAEEWKFKEQIIADYPDKKDEIESATNVLSHTDIQSIIGTVAGSDTPSTDQSDMTKPSDPEGKDPERFRYRIKTCYWKHYEKRRFLIDFASGEVKPIDDGWWSKFKSKLKSVLGTVESFSVVARTVPVLNYTRMIGDVELEHIEDPFTGVTKFPWIRFIADYQNGYPKGEIEDIIPAQKETNKRYSQLLHHLNQSANSGWMSPSGAFGGVGCSTLEDVAKFGAKSGTHLIYDGTKGTPQRLQPVSLSEGHFRLATLGNDLIKIISGVNPDTLGEKVSSGDSGVAIGKRIEQGVTNTEEIYDNFRYTQKILGETILDFLRHTDVISEDEMMAIVQESALEIKDPKTGQPIPFAEIHRQLKSRRVGKYGVMTNLSTSTMSAKIDSFNSLVEMVKAGIRLPDDLLIKNHPTLPEGDKQEAVARIIQIQEQMQLAQQVKPMKK